MEKSMNCKKSDYVLFRKKSKKNQMQIYKGQIVDVNENANHYIVETDNGHQMIITEANIDKVL